MNLKSFITLEAIFIIMLMVITWRQDCSLIKLFQCSRERSKIVRDVIYKKFIPIFVKHHVNMSYECPFHPEREFLWWPLIDEVSESPIIEHDNEHHHHPSYWTCPFCGIDFHCSERLIYHWDTEHRYSQQYKEELVCLADYCGIFRCEIIMKNMLQKRKRFLNYLSFGRLINEKYQHKCDPENMFMLQEICFNVIQQCTIGIEINISSQTVWTLRKELSDSLCSYLTCEHYNDDLFNEDQMSHKVPIILFTTVGAIMLGGFFLIYFLIWNTVKRGLINDYEENSAITTATSHVSDKTSVMMTSKNKRVRPELKIPGLNSGRKAAYNKQSNNNLNQTTSKHYCSDDFFQNIFEFNHDRYDSFEYEDFEPNQQTTTNKQYKSKLHSINNIIIEEEEGESEMMDLSINSYPNISSKHFKRNPHYKSKMLSKQNSLESQRTNDMKSIKSQEICFQELPMRFHSKYIQPIKHSYSDQSYPCYTGPMSESFSMLSDKSRSFSHSQLQRSGHGGGGHHHPHHYHHKPHAKPIRRQYSMMEGEVMWPPRLEPQTQPQPPPHHPQMPSARILSNLNNSSVLQPSSQMAINQLTKLPTTSSEQWNATSVSSKPRISRSAMSYHMMHPSKRRELFAASKTNSDASIGSGSSRYTASSNPASFKT